MAQSGWVATALSVGLILALVGAVWLVADNGIEQTWEVVTGDCTANCTATTNATYGGDVGFADRAVTVGAMLTILTGLGAISASGAGNPRIVRDIIRYYPLLVGVLAAISFSDIVSSFIDGSYDFDAFSDGQNAFHIYIVGSAVAAFASLLGMRGK